MAGETKTTPHIRREVWDLSDKKMWHPVIEYYARAIRILQSRDGQTSPIPPGG